MNILITGANRGLGLFLTKVGLKKGHHIFAGVRNISPEATQSLQELQNLYPEKLEIIPLDVIDEGQVSSAANLLREKNQYLEVIVNNAAVLLERDKTIEELDMDEVIRSFDINTVGSMRVVKHFLPLLKGEQQSIINISSEAGSITNSYSIDYPYGLSKVAMNMFTEKLKVYLKDRDVQVLSIHPGWMKTDMGGDQAPTDPNDTAFGIFNIIERQVDIQSLYAFVDYKGQPMTI
ncbi:SDR family oxidoreductase [Litchfieldia alkalitelluris]|uniref:SDR family oxidoreductase n=1 Tax=Litchfieldia alkalitelluris TaxID=304268 RepID=UPI00099666B7|nr:SDR family oxidoreductase [Litchfieldia alkalitelluris]